MTESRIFDQRSAELRVQTGVAGRSARLGHRLTLEPRTWRAEVELADGAPTSLAVTVDAGSLDVISGEGGLKALSAPERVVATANTLRSLRVKTFPTIAYRSVGIDRVATGFAVRGLLEICGVERDCALTIDVADGSAGSGSGALTTAVQLRQTDFGVKPFSLMMGTLSVADEVTVTASAIP